MSLPRAYFSLQAVQGSILAVGGVTNAGYTADVEVFNMADEAWARPHPALELGLQTPRSAFATVFLVNKTLEEEEEDLVPDFDGPQPDELKDQIIELDLFPNPTTTTAKTTYHRRRVLQSSKARNFPAVIQVTLFFY